MIKRRTYQQLKELFFGGNTKPDDGLKVLEHLHEHRGNKNIKVGISSISSYPD